MIIFYAIQISVYWVLIRKWIFSGDLYLELAVFELISIFASLIQNGVKFAVNFYEGFIETQFHEKKQWFMIWDLIILGVLVLFQIAFVFKLSYKHNYPILLARDFMFSIVKGMNLIKGSYKGFKLAAKVKTFKSVDMPEEICGICLYPITSKGRQLPCGHVFHESCLM